MPDYNNYNQPTGQQQWNRQSPPPPPPPNGYGQGSCGQGYYNRQGPWYGQQQPMPQEQNTIGLVGFILSCVALFFSWLNIVGWPVWFVGFVLSCIGLSKRPRGFAVAGFVISLIFPILVFFLLALLLGLASIPHESVTVIVPGACDWI